jgi:hypothetical protein
MTMQHMCRRHRCCHRLAQKHGMRCCALKMSRSLAVENLSEVGNTSSTTATIASITRTHRRHYNLCSQTTHMAVGVMPHLKLQKGSHVYCTCSIRQWNHLKGLRDKIKHQA